MSVECPARQGLHVFEDAFVVQIVDPDSDTPVPDGEPGSLCVTEIYKTGSPQFRYDIQDLSVLHTDAGIPLTIGDNVSVGHQVMLHGCTIGDGSLIGIRSVILNGA